MNGNKYMVPVVAFVGGVMCGQFGKQVGKDVIDILRVCRQFLYDS